MTISLLIPVCDYDIVAMVHSMKRCLPDIPEFIEILIGDDGSSPSWTDKYRSLNGPGVRIIRSEKNIGRAAIRNLLALEAKGDHLLFIDADTMIPGTPEAFIRNWIDAAGIARVIFGGVLYHETPPGDPDKILRWKNGRRREQKKAAIRNKHPYASFSTFNVLIEKNIFEKLRFNEEIRQYGHEDTLFSYQLKKAGIDIGHIDNGLIHEGLESNRDYLNKTKLRIENLSKLYDFITDKKTFASTVRMIRLYRILSLLKLNLILAGFFIRFREKMELKIDSANPRLILFSVYKVTMFCTFREIHRRKKTVPTFVL
ncbi:MAG TPA: glycosyltransferase family A protein [Bacteroidales bacterium]|nr:glycosyltransferase family A protein [Bacteroidales bacterium]HPJ58621.1 glycosyltransferase family A protein [Bacteroidales bacterium]HPR11220.1 glycosyltransferase family A protein [Bacteroidales bacterium]HRW85496.1 glycosyltransferase family A protein [Bacteroidales bacterium]